MSGLLMLSVSVLHKMFVQTFDEKVQITARRYLAQKYFLFETAVINGAPAVYNSKRNNTLDLIMRKYLNLKSQINLVIYNNPKIQ